MSTCVWLSARTLESPEAGGHFWAQLNWALGLRANGCRVVWLEPVASEAPEVWVQERVAILRRRLRGEGFEDLALCSFDGSPLSPRARSESLDLEAAREADLLLDVAYGIPAALVGRFRRSALLDIDPGLLQLWMSRGLVRVAPHDLYFTTGETVGRPDAGFPDCGLAWHYTPPCIDVTRWTPQSAPPSAPFTTVSSWYMEDWIDDPGAPGGGYANDKRSGFLPFLDLPRRTAQPLELAIHLAGLREERKALEERGWRVREARDVASTPDDYRRYVQRSRGEFGCAKPSCLRLRNAWLSDRTLCYLASGKPAVVQHTGPSRLLPDAEGLFRFHTLEEAARCLEAAVADYGRHCERARSLAEAHFEARAVVRRVLERALA